MQEYTPFSSRFAHNRYAIMLHADHFTLTPTQEGNIRRQKLLVNTPDMCKQNIEMLVRLVLSNMIGKIDAVVTIFHALDIKCVLTADLVLNSLKMSHIRSCKKPLRWLANESFGMDSDHIKQVCDVANPLNFSIFVTHLSVFQMFLGTAWEPKNGAIITKEFIIVDSHRNVTKQ
jgi:hypothetical protein